MTLYDNLYSPKIRYDIYDIHVKTFTIVLAVSSMKAFFELLLG